MNSTEYNVLLEVEVVQMIILIANGMIRAFIAVGQMVCAVLFVGLWNSIFLWSNISLILLMPFAYFFIESQGLPGARKVTVFVFIKLL